MGYLDYTCGNPCHCGGVVYGCSCDEIYLNISKIRTDVDAIEEKVEEIEASGGVTTEKVREMLNDYTYDKGEIDELLAGVEAPDNLVAVIKYENGRIVAKNLSDVTLSSIDTAEILSSIRVENNTLIIP